MTPQLQDLWFLPLGGCGEIGMNLNLYGHDGQWLMVDCGVTFAPPNAPPSVPQLQMADPRFISDRKEQLAGLVITHAHEDHIGAVAHLWPLLRCPVYTTPFTAAILERKLGEVGLAGFVPVHIVPPRGRRTIGVFDVEWIHLTHSIPDPSALMIRTPAGSVFHTADWKLDANPVLGERFQAASYETLGQEGVRAMVCDSTNALVPGHSISEATLAPHLKNWVQSAPQRVVFACFASNLARLITLARIAQHQRRHFTVIGRSLERMIAVARQQDLWPDDLSVMPARDAGYCPRNSVLAVATGSQGEPRAALAQLARDRHPAFGLETGDRVVFSSRTIPGNELAITQLIQQLTLQGIEVVTDSQPEAPIHASGHPAEEELKMMYQWVRPQLAIPVHGEAAHMQANATIAKATGVLQQCVGQNGDLFMIAPVTGIQRGAVAVGRLGLQGEMLVGI